jgi:hypothetical protein
MLTEELDVAADEGASPWNTFWPLTMMSTAF